MKKVITGKELYDCEEKAIALLCGTVKKTLGPRGSNAIIDHSLMNPFITNDGVTIARNIESEDERINTILTLAKEASIKTDETVGDGTTTTLVLLESLFKSGLAKIKDGLNPHLLKNELDEALENIIEEIKKESKTPTEENYYNIASIAASNKSIGKLITRMYLKVGSAIKIEESKTSETYTKIINGYSFEPLLASPYFFNNTNEIIYKNSLILIMIKEVNEIGEISEIINYTIEKRIPLVILATDYTEEVINEVLSLNLSKITNVTLLKLPEYGLHQMEVLKDLEIISNAKIAKSSDELSLNNLGKCEEIKITKELATINNNLQSKVIKRHINNLKEKISTIDDDFELEFQSNRLSKLTNGIGIIYVGATTTTEAREKKMRFDDAFCALNCAANGIIPGSGLILLKIKENLETKNNGSIILKEALDKPFMQILENVGINPSNIYNKIKAGDFNIIYNVFENKFETISKTKVIDPTTVVITSLKNAVSIAGMLLTTTSLIINEQQESINYNLNNEL
ncbi:MAG TPA: chaperonin GroEL [Candidatus Caccenecus avistercoris]|nr:chaperonin GroEL [Candidatus Caccenecus avistercoris]